VDQIESTSIILAQQPEIQEANHKKAETVTLLGDERQVSAIQDETKGNAKTTDEAIPSLNDKVID